MAQFEKDFPEERFWRKKGAQGMENDPFGGAPIEVILDKDNNVLPINPQLMQIILNDPELRAEMEDIGEFDARRLPGMRELLEQINQIEEGGIIYIENIQEVDQDRPDNLVVDLEPRGP